VSWSLLNSMVADKVDALLANELLAGLQDGERALTKAQATAVIHAALWAYSARSGSFASAYAMDNLFHVLELETWTFKQQVPQPERTP